MSSLSRCILFVFALGLAGCAFEPGNGQVTTQSRGLDQAFTRVSLNSGFSAELGLGPRALSLTTDENLLQYIETFVDGETLVVRVRPGTGVSPTHGLRVAVVTEALLGLDSNGGCEVNALASPADTWQLVATGGSGVSVHGLEAHKLIASASGGSRVTASGTASVLQLSGSGGSHFNTEGVPAEDVNVDGSGGSSFEVHASKSITGALSGGSTAAVSGNPASQHVDLSGGSQVTWVTE